ncbi:hypothetical protein C2845_PM02G26090 [Panicum miliaceum]|uniref:Uncharacterized protein n=1 Tax=Panicum miliaceum TaxID=4540 RepID=A0A3L6S6P4_PANMI|nr:hypothetical protein C2845_PM02G26090 [Panicum miliaceum]
MRSFTTKTRQSSFVGAVNILSVKIACSDVGYPVEVYDTVVIARDSINGSWRAGQSLQNQGHNNNRSVTGGMQG